MSEGYFIRNISSRSSTAVTTSTVRGSSCGGCCAVHAHICVPSNPCTAGELAVASSGKGIHVSKVLGVRPGTSGSRI